MELTLLVLDQRGNQHCLVHRIKKLNQIRRDLVEELNSQELRIETLKGKYSRVKRMGLQRDYLLWKPFHR
jgi:hypothetical protein